MVQALIAVVPSVISLIVEVAKAKSSSSEPTGPTFKSVSFDGGDNYTGYYANGKKNGQGTYKFASGNTYTGNWINNDYHG